VVSLARLKPLIGDFFVTFESMRLEKRTLVGIQTQPGRDIEDRINIFFGPEPPIDVLNSQDQLPAAMTRVEPAEKRRAMLPRWSTPVGLGAKRVRTVIGNQCLWDDVTGQSLGIVLG
jgi:hypothetical protein